MLSIEEEECWLKVNEFFFIEKNKMNLNRAIALCFGMRRIRSKMVGKVSERERKQMICLTHERKQFERLTNHFRSAKERSNQNAGSDLLDEST